MFFEVKYTDKPFRNDGKILDRVEDMLKPATKGSIPTQHRSPRVAELDAAIAAEDALECHRPKTRKARPGKRTPERHAGKSLLAKAKKRAREAAEAIVRRFGHELTRAERIQVAQEVRSVLVPRQQAGRRRDQIITRAVELVKSGDDWRKHLPELFHGWQAMGEWRKNAKVKKLEDAVRMRMRRENHALTREAS